MRRDENFGKDGLMASAGFPLAIILCAIITITGYLVLSNELFNKPRATARVFVPLATEAVETSR